MRHSPYNDGDRFVILRHQIFDLHKPIAPIFIIGALYMRFIYLPMRHSPYDDSNRFVVLRHQIEGLDFIGGGIGGHYLVTVDRQMVGHRVLDDVENFDAAFGRPNT